MRKNLIGLAAVFALASCGVSKDLGGDLYNLNHYGNVQPQKIRFQGITWGILDKPEEGRMIVVPVNDVRREARYEQYAAAAQDYFERAKRYCTVGNGKLASRTDFSVEFFYSCQN